MKDEEYAELIEKARTADLVDYFRTSGYTLKKISGEVYINEIKGLSIKPETNSWFSHYNQVGRVNNSIDCLTIILDKSFKDAVYELTGQDISRSHSNNSYEKKSKSKVLPTVKQHEEIKEKKEMVMPEHAPTQRRVFGYLHSGRYIPNEVIRELIKKGLGISQMSGAYRTSFVIFWRKICRLSARHEAQLCKVKEVFLAQKWSKA